MFKLKRLLPVALCPALICVAAGGVCSPAQAYVGCPGSYVCIYDNADTPNTPTGRHEYPMSRWPGSLTGPVFFRPGDRASNRTSGYVNNSGYRWCAWDLRFGFYHRIFYMYPHSRSGYVGPGANDKADNFTRC
jgi:hypothetical protein